ncbi:MAG TPA: DUF192 domain-containing protein [archaeon]|nr:DUF192 domain-containing protein [archaeon]
MKIYGLLASIIIVVVLLLLSIPLLKPKYEGKVVGFLTDKGTVNFDVEVADTPIKRAVGLMNRTSLSDKSGMLFIFDQEGIQGFWMKSTLIPLDMIFISTDQKIVNIQSQAQPCKVLDCQTYSSIKPAKYVVEINGGLADKLGIVEGQKVKL